MIESEKELLSTRPQEQIGRWAEQIERASIKRSRYQDQEAEGLMTREELRTKLAELDEAIGMAEGEIEKLRSHEERIRTMEEAGEELIERYAKLIPEELQNLSPAEKRRIYQTLQISASDQYLSAAGRRDQDQAAFPRRRRLLSGKNRKLS